MENETQLRVVRSIQYKEEDLNGFIRASPVRWARHVKMNDLDPCREQKSRKV